MINLEHHEKYGRKSNFSRRDRELYYLFPPGETRSRFSFYYSHVSRRKRENILLFSCFETRTRNTDWISQGWARKISVNSHEISREREFSLISVVIPTIYILSLYSSHKVNAEHTMDHRKWIRKRRTRLGWQPNIRPNWTFCTQILHSSICTQKLGPQMEERARWSRPVRPAGWRRLTSSHLFPPTQQGVAHLQ